MMDSGKVNDWLQVGGIFGVLGGLIFVGLQLMQDRQIAATELVADAADRRMYWAELIGQSPDVWVKGLSGQPLSVSEAAQFDALATSWELSALAWAPATTPSVLMESSASSAGARTATIVQHTKTNHWHNLILKYNSVHLMP